MKECFRKTMNILLSYFAKRTGTAKRKRLIEYICKESFDEFIKKYCIMQK